MEISNNINDIELSKESLMKNFKKKLWKKQCITKTKIILLTFVILAILSIVIIHIKNII